MGRTKVESFSPSKGTHERRDETSPAPRTLVPSALCLSRSARWWCAESPCTVWMALPPPSLQGTSGGSSTFPAVAWSRPFTTSSGATSSVK